MATHIPTNATLRFQLERRKYRLGRASGEESEEKLSIPFDPRLSRRTATLKVAEGSIEVERDGSRYPLFHEGEEKETFQLLPGQRFSSGETVFELISQTAQTLTVQALDLAKRENPEEILKVLLGLQGVLGGWRHLSELAERTIELLGELLPGARVALFKVDERAEINSLTESSLRPSRSLVADSLNQGLPVYHQWKPAASDQPTQFCDESWVLAAPVISSADRLLLYALGYDSQNSPGELQRSALALVAQTLSQHLEGRRSIVLAAQVEAEQKANIRLRTLLSTVERSLSLQDEGVEAAFLEGARILVGADEARFSKDVGEWMDRPEPELLAVAFEHYRPKGILCRKAGGFEGEDQDWLAALLGFAETVFENRRLHSRVHSTLEELQKSQAQLIRSSQWAAAGRLAANSAHELNTPLGAIKLAAETAQSFLGSGPKPALDGLKLIGRSVERCRKVTERLLVYSKPRDEKELEAFSLEKVVQDSLSSLGPYLRIRPVEVEWEPGDCEVFGDVQDAYWAVTTVLKNAFDALADEPVRRVRLTIGPRGTLLIEDSGPGVTEHVRAHLFEPFVTTKKLGEGNGLGLAISRRDLRSWGGEIELRESELGGAAFLLSFPRGE